MRAAVIEVRVADLENIDRAIAEGTHFVVMPRAYRVPIPDGIDPAVAAAVPSSALTPEVAGGANRQLWSDRPHAV